MKIDHRKIEQAKKLLIQKHELEFLKDGTKTDRQNRMQAILLEIKPALKNLNLNSEEINYLVKWQKTL